MGQNKNIFTKICAVTKLSALNPGNLGRIDIDIMLPYNQVLDLYDEFTKAEILSAIKQHLDNGKIEPHEESMTVNLNDVNYYRESNNTNYYVPSPQL